MTKNTTTQDLPKQTSIVPAKPKTIVNLIAAVGRRGQLGLNGTIPWHDSSDFKWFKKMTMNQVVVMGQKTVATLPPLPGREVFTMTSSMTPEQILKHFEYREEIWIAGGAKTYEKWMPFINRYYIGQIDYDGDADVWMPDLGFQEPI